jgi:hypothetical protein
MTYPITCSCLGAVGVMKLNPDELLRMFVESYPHLVDVARNRSNFDLRGPEWASLRAAYIDVSNRYAFHHQEGDHSPEAYQRFLERLQGLRNGRGRCGGCGIWLFRLLDTHEIPAAQALQQESAQAYA